MWQLAYDMSHCPVAKWHLAICKGKSKRCLPHTIYQKEIQMYYDDQWQN